ncbi:MAG: ATP-binding cassette domain-containing protein [Spirochaetales bacterium]
MALLGFHNLSYSIGADAILDDVSLYVQRGERITVLGRNGAGKSTMLRIASGDLLPDAGHVALEKGAKIAYLGQQVPHGLAGEAIDVAADPLPGEDPEESAHRRLLAEQVLTRLDVPADTDVSTASGGVKRRVLLARALAAGADVLMLDEPTNHLDIDTVLWLEEYLLRLSNVEKRAILLVTHDRELARRLTTRVAELDRGSLYVAETDYDTFVARRKAELEQEANSRREFDKKLAAEEAWLRKGIKARQTRNEGRVRRLQEMREQRRRRRERSETANMAIETATRSGDIVVETEKLSFSFPNAPIVSGLTTIIERGDRVGIVGPNGSGKTTLIRLLLGELTPDSGSVKHGAGLEIVYFDQMREQLDPSASLYRNVGDGYDTVKYGGRDRHLTAYLKDFLFTELDMNKPAHALSGGETNRLLLAKLFTRPSNVLVLDEPTNDLDNETLELLEQLLADYPGTIILVSHDRAFLDNVVTECLVLTGGGEVVEYTGGYSDWRKRERQRLASVAQRRGSTASGQRTGASRSRGEAGTGRSRTDGGEGRGGGRNADPAANETKRLGFQEKRDLENLPARIAELESEFSRVQEALADPQLYRDSDGDRVKRLTEQYRRLEQEIINAYERWEALEARSG